MPASPLWKRIAVNSGLLMGARVVSKLATIAVMVVVARSLGTSSFGEFSMVLAWTAFVGLVSDFGMVLPTVRAMSIDTPSPPMTVGGTVPARALWSGVALVGMSVASVALNVSVVVAVFLAISSVLEATATALIRSFESRQEMGTITVYTVIERLSYAFFLIGGLAIFRTVEAVAVASAVSFLLMCGLALILHRRRFGRMRLSWSWAEVRRTSRIGLPFLATALFSAVYYKADTILMGAMRTTDEVGIYSAAMRIIDAQIFVPMTLMASIFPALARQHSDRSAGFGSTLRGSLILFAGVGFLLSAAMFLLAPLLIPVLFSETYARSIPVLQTLSVMLLFYYLYFLFSHGLIAMNREHWFTGAMVAAAVLNVTVNLLVIPRYGVLGAAATRVGTEVLLCVSTGTALAFLLRRKERPSA
jgi:O-antigen/teichoic acid export membrane protein